MGSIIIMFKWDAHEMYKGRNLEIGLHDYMYYSKIQQNAMHVKYVRGSGHLASSFATMHLNLVGMVSSSHSPHSVDPLNHNRSIRVTGMATAQVRTRLHTWVHTHAKGQRLLPFWGKVNFAVWYYWVSFSRFLVLLFVLLFLCSPAPLTPINALARFFCMSKISHYK